MDRIFTADFAENMTYIHQRVDWPRFHWDQARLSPILASARFLQGHLLGKLENLGFSLRSEATLATLTADVTQSSAIEGERFDAAEVRSSIARRLGMDPGGLAPSSRQVDEVVEMMLDATQRFQAPLTEEDLFGWNAALFPSGRSGLRTIVTGRWRTEESGPMRVVSGPVGRERVHFEAPGANRLASEMATFLNWVNGEGAIDPVIKAGVAHFWFLTIHPFEDGNGRIGRAIADRLLARADGSAERFYSLSAQIETERKDYYRNLEISQRGDLDITGWLEWYLGCLSRAIERSEARLLAILNKAKVWESANRGPVNDRQRIVINRLLDDFIGKLTTSKYAKLAKCSPDTALRDIRALVDRGILIEGDSGGRSTHYRLAP